MDGDIVLKPAAPILGSPWSPFHSEKLPLVKPPGTPVRQFVAPSLALPVDVTPTTKASTTAASPTSYLVEEVKEHFSDLDLLLEYKLLHLHHYHGVYVIPSMNSLHEWHGVIFVKSGPFQCGVFRFTIYIPDGFPHLRPMVKFLSRVSHPYVHKENGSLNLLRGLPWEPGKSHIWHVVHYAASCFYEAETWEDMATDDKGDSFEKQAQSCVEESLKTLYDPGINEGGLSISFKDIDEKKFQDILITMAKGEMPRPPDSQQSSLLSSVTDQFKQWWKGNT